MRRNSTRRRTSTSVIKQAQSAILSPEDLQEFRLRHAALTAAAHQHLMVNEAYQRWVKDMGARYEIKGQFNIDAQTGVVHPVSVVSKGN